MKSRSRLSWLIFLTLALLFFLHGAYYYPFLSDDALISLRYAQRFAHGQGLTWTDGPPVEGYSNLLWVLLASIGAFLRSNLVVWIRVIGAACSLCMLAALLARRSWAAAGWRQDLIALVSSLGLVLAAPLAIWSIGGLEQPLFASLALWSILFLTKPDGRSREFRASLLLALLVLTRVDGVILVGGMILGDLLFHVAPVRKRLRRGTVLLSLPIAAYLGQLVFRLWYYGAWVSNTTLAKVSIRGSRLSEGLTYCRVGLWPLAPVFGIACLLLLVPSLERGRRSRVGLLVVTCAVWAAYIGFVGGDIFPGWRLLTPIYALTSLLIFELLDAAGALRICRPDARTSRWAFLGFVAAGFCFALVSSWYQWRDGENQRGKTERWEFAGEATGLLLERAFGTEQPLVAVNAAGAIPFFSELPALDMLGLTDRWLALHPPTTFGTGPIGHELGDGAYVLRRAPDIVVVSGPWGSRFPALLGETQMMSTAEFFKKYAAIEWTVPEPYTPALLWLRRNSPRIGPRRDGETWFVPAYYFNASMAARIDVDERGVSGQGVAPGRPATLEALSLSPGEWRFSARGGEALHLKVADAATREALAEGDLPLEARVRTSPQVRLEITPGGGAEQARFRGLVAHALRPPAWSPGLELVEGYAPTLNHDLFWNLSTRSVAEIAGVILVDQDMRKFGAGWSDDDQLFGIWQDMRGVVEFDFTSLRAKTIRIEITFSTAPDFGDWELSLNQEFHTTIDTRSATVKVARKTLNGWVAELGLNRLRITPARAAAQASAKWGVDTIRITETLPRIPTDTE
jgi:hypothetical protein